MDSPVGTNPPDIRIIADDLTGAADTGLAFWKVGLPVQIRFATAKEPLPSPYQPEGSTGMVQVISTETRHASAEDARILLGNLGKSESPNPNTILFKKIDSTLRGWVGVEIRALLDTFPKRIAWIVPSYPKLGRRMENGVYSVKGIPLATTEFAREIPNCPDDSRVASLLEAQMGEPVGFIECEILERGVEAILAHVNRITKNGMPRALLFDATTDLHISQIIMASLFADPVPLWVGSAGLAGPMAVLASPPRPDSRHLSYWYAITPAPPGPVLIAAGSRNPVTRRQIDFLKGQLPLLQHRIVGSETENVSEAETAPLILTLPEVEPAIGVPNPLAMAARLGEAATQTIQRTGSRRFFLTGGDIAAATCRCLNVESLEIVGLVEEGIPLLRLRGGMADGALAVTKAGGFGTEESLYHAVKLLQETYE